MPDFHNLHGEIIGVRLAVMRAIKRMKDEARDEPDVSLKTIYDRNRTKCLEEGKALIEGDIPLWVLGDIISPDGGGLMQYPNFRGTLVKIREKTTPVLPTTINDILFELEEY